MNRREAMAALAVLPLAAGAAAQEAKKEPPMIAGPDPNTRTPAFKAPPSAIDCQAHIFGPAAQFPYQPDRGYTPPDSPLAAFRALHEKIGIERAVIVNSTIYGKDNRVVLDALAQSGGKYKAVVNIDDATTDKEIEAMEAAGIRGCRFAFLARLGGTPDFSRVKRAADRVKAVNWSIDLYLEPQMIEPLSPQMEALPVPYVIDHMGAVKAAQGIDQPAFKALLALARRDPKCWIKIMGPERMSATGAPFADTIPFARALIEAAPDRVIWGSDWPHPNVPVMPNDGDLVDLIPQFAPDEAQRRKLLVDNPVRLYRF